jgi:hypothetical protein
MKKQILILFVAITFNVINTFAQNVEYWIEPTTKKPKGLTQPIILGVYNKNIYAMQAKYSNMYTDNIKLDVYSEDLVLQSMTDLLSKDPSPATIEYLGGKFKEEFDNVFMIENKIYMFTTVFNKESNKYKAYARIFNENGELIKNMTELDEKQKEKGFWNMGVSKFIYRLSEDRTKILVIHYPSIKDKYSNERIYFKIYNQELELQKSGDIELPYKDKAMTIQKIMITNDGNIDILASVVVDFKSKVKGESRYFYNISVVNPDDPSNINTFEVKLAKEYISDISISLDSVNNIICCGFYGHETSGFFTSSAIIGTFFIKIDGKTNEYVVQSKKPFDSDFLSEFKRDRKVSKGAQGLSSFTMRDLVHRDDGGIVMVAEQYYVITYQTYNSSTGTWSTHYEYHYEDIIVINIRPDGNIDWYTRIPKHQVSSGGTQFFSYAMAVVKDKMYFIYLDNPKNMGFKSSKNMKVFNNPKSGVAVMATVSNDGSVKKEQLFTSKEVKSYLIPSSHMPINDNELIINSQFKNNWKLLRLAFKD